MAFALAKTGGRYCIPVVERPPGCTHRFSRVRRGLIFVSSDILDPIELAQGEISRSKDAIASAAKELDQHDRWLKDFIAAEKRNRARHARWIRRKQAAEHFRLKRQRMARSGKRATLYCAVFARSASRSSAKGLAYAGRQIWQCATWVGKNSYAFSVVLLKMLSIGGSWTSTKVRAVALASFRAVLVSVSWVAAKTKALTAVLLTMLATSFAWMWTKAGILARTARRGVSVSSSLFVANGRALASVLAGAAFTGFARTRARSQDWASVSLKAAVVSGSWLAVRGRALASVSAGAASAGFAHTRARSQDWASVSLKAAAVLGSGLSVRASAWAIASRDAAVVGSAWTAARTRTLARASSAAAVSKGQVVVVATRDAASIGSAWTAEKTRTFARASLSAASTGKSWMRAGAKDLAHKLHRAGAIASPWLPAATHRTADGLLILTGAARRIAERQGENASLLVLRLKAQVKGDLDALRRAALAGTLTPPIWRKFAAVVSSGTDLASGLARNGDSMKTKDPSEPEAQYAAFRDRSSRNALICVEPWRCRLPVVQADNPRGPLAPRG